MRAPVLAITDDPAFVAGLMALLAVDGDVRWALTADEVDIEADVVVLAGRHSLADLDSVRVHPKLHAARKVLVAPGMALDRRALRASDVWTVTTTRDVTKHTAAVVQTLLYLARTRQDVPIEIHQGRATAAATA